MYRSTALALISYYLAFLVSAFQITGAQLGFNVSQLQDIPQRREISDLVNNGLEFDLYILALQRFQLRDQSQPLSYFQIAGIHGYPKRAWDGVDGNGSYPGFCTHAAVVFPTWHRTYLALFEQMISAHAQYIAELYPLEERDQYRAAAQTLRVPYWDWARHPGLPTTTTVPTIFVNTPEGPQWIANPLYEYRFHAGPEGNGFPPGHPLADLNMTTRYYNYTSGQRNDSKATDVLLANAANTLAMTYQLLSSVTNYTTMSCTSPGGAPNRVVNIEAIHNNIHNFVGGFSGHMFWPEIAAFDPIFWLHHGNVDRLFALWQALHPTAYVSPIANPYGSFAEHPGTIDSGSSALAPFHADSGSTFWTSDRVRSTTALAYTYPELDLPNASAATLAAHVRGQVNSLYALSSTRAREATEPGVKRTAATASFSRVSLAQAKQLAVNNAATQWSVFVQVNPATLGTSLGIDIFMGQPPIPAQRATAQNLVGSFAQFSVDRTCTSMIDVPVARSLSGEVSLTHVLSDAVSRGILDDLTPASVIPLLQKHLNWAGRTENNQEVDLSQLVGFSVLVRSQEVEPRASDCDFPNYGPVHNHPEVTGARFSIPCV